VEQLIQSAALYCQRDTEGHLSIEWLDGVIQLLTSHALPVREYGVERNPVCRGGLYSFREENRQLYAALRTGKLRSLELYCHTQERRDLVFDWEGNANIDLGDGYVHVGLPVSSGLSADELLRQTYLLARSSAAWRYGIAYRRSSELAPSLFAVGFQGGRGVIGSGEAQEESERIGCWFRELLFPEDRRHLRGYFRDVYPANLLSAEHVNARLGRKKTLRTAGWGTFTPLDEGHWLWTLPEEDIPPARAALVQAGFLICP
jgi:hypothetical protein